MTSREKQLVDMLRRVLVDGAHSTTLEAEAKELIEAFEHPPSGRELRVHELTVKNFYVHVVSSVRDLFYLRELNGDTALGDLLFDGRWRGWQLDGISTNTMLCPLSEEEEKTWAEQLKRPLR